MEITSWPWLPLTGNSLDKLLRIRGQHLNSFRKTSFTIRLYEALCNYFVNWRGLVGGKLTSVAGSSLPFIKQDASSFFSLHCLFWVIFLYLPALSGNSHLGLVPNAKRVNYWWWELSSVCVCLDCVCGVGKLFAMGWITAWHHHISHSVNTTKTLWTPFFPQHKHTHPEQTIGPFMCQSASISCPSALYVVHEQNTGPQWTQAADIWEMSPLDYTHSPWMCRFSQECCGSGCMCRSTELPPSWVEDSKS